MHNRKKECFEMLVDIPDLNRLLEFDIRWFPHYNWSNKSYYGRATQYLGTINGKPKYKMYYIQKYLVDYDYEHTGKKRICLDHIDHNTLDNRRKNLRIIKERFNNTYRKQRNSNNKSGHRNVCLIGDWYYIQLQINGKNHRFKERFKDVEEAAKFARVMREKYYGEFAGDG
jgi:hypothetical protein